MFDPYHKWLGIPPKYQPPNHYRLLGLDPFESDAEVIDTAANRQMAYLQQRATGEHAAQSQKLLNEISAARLCLLNAEKKAEYDAQLKGNLSETGVMPDTATPTDVEVTQAAARTPTTHDGTQRRNVLNGSPKALEPWHYAVAIGAAFLVLFGGWAVFFRDDNTVSIDENMGEETAAISAQVAGSGQTTETPPTTDETAEESADRDTEETVSPDTPDAEVVKPAIYNVTIEPSWARMEVKDGKGVVSGSGRERTIAIQNPVRNWSVQFVVSCDGYVATERWLWPSSGTESTVTISLKKEPSSAPRGAVESGNVALASNGTTVTGPYRDPASGGPDSLHDWGSF